jgi:predicted MFS family arabinose efflux permease
LLVSELACRFRSVRALTLGMVVIFASASLMLLVWDYASLLVFIIGMRIGAAVYHPIGLALVAKRFEGKGIDMAMGIQSSAGDMGVLLAFITTGALGALFDWRSSFALWGAICLGVAGLGIALMSGLKKSDSADACPKDNSMGWREAVRRIGILLVPLTIGGAGYNIIITYAPLMLRALYGLAIEQYALIIALWVGTGAAFTLIFGRITGRGGRGAAIIVSYVLVMAAGLIVWLQPPLEVVILAMAVYGAGLFMTYPALFAYVTEMTGGKRSEKAFGIVFTAQLAGGSAFAYVCGVAADMYGIRAPFLVLSAIALAALFVTAYYLARLRPRPSR